MNTSFQFGGALVLAVVTAVNAAAAGPGSSPASVMDGYQAAIAVAVIAAILGVVATAARRRAPQPAAELAEGGARVGPAARDLGASLAPSGGRGGPRSQAAGEETIVMPRGSSPKRERQYEHIRDSAKARGASTKRAKEIAARTVNKERARSGEAKTASKTSTDDMSSGRRGGKRSGTSGPRGRTRDQLYAEAKEAQHRGALEDEQGAAAPGGGRAGSSPASYGGPGRPPAAHRHSLTSGWSAPTSRV